MQVLCLASSQGYLPWQQAEPLSPAAEVFVVLLSPLCRGLVGPRTPKSQPAGDRTACLCPAAREGSRLRQHKCIKGSLEESLLEAVSF